MKKDVEKKKKNRSGFIRKFQEVTIILIIIAVMVLVGSQGLGLKKGSGDGDRSLDAYKNKAEVTDTDPEETIVTTVLKVSETTVIVTEPETEKVEIKVSGQDYLYLNSKIELSSFIDKLSEYSKDTEIRISADNTATINTMDDLTEALEKNGFTNYYKVK